MLDSFGLARWRAMFGESRPPRPERTPRMSSANLSLRTAIKLTRYSDLPTWPSRIDAPQHIGYDLDAGSLSLTVSFSNGQDITVRDTGDGLDATGPYMERLFAED